MLPLAKHLKWQPCVANWVNQYQLGTLCFIAYNRIHTRENQLSTKIFSHRYILSRPPMANPAEIELKHWALNNV
jgi:hypothetical protein